MDKVIDIEVTQGLQALASQAKQPLRLFAGKKALARIYLSGIENNSDVESRLVEGILRVRVHGKKLAAQARFRSVNILEQVKSRTEHLPQLRLKLEHTLNFEFRISDLIDEKDLGGDRPAKVFLELESLIVNGEITEVAKNKIAIRFEKGKSLNLQMLGLRYRSQDESVYYPSTEHFMNIKDSLENLYPVNRCRESHIVVDADPEFTLPFSDVDESEPDWEWFYKVSLAHAQLLAHRTLDLDANLIFERDNSKLETNPAPVINPKLSQTWYYGVADFPDDDFFRGAASGIQNAGQIAQAEENELIIANFDYVACGPVEDAGGLYAAHEIAHCLDLHHPGIGDQPKVEPDYPFTAGLISVDSYPEGELFKYPDRIDEKNIDGFVKDSFTNDALINNKTLGLIVERYQKNRYQGPGDINKSIALLKASLENWREAIVEYGQQHQGFSWGSWKHDRKLLSHSEHYDFMGYLEPKWISAFSYIKLYNNIDRFVEHREVVGTENNPPNICIIGLYNEFLGAGQIKYLFKTFEQPGQNDSGKRSVQIRFDGHAIDSRFIFHKDRDNNKLQDPAFFRAGVFKCVIPETGCFVDEKIDLRLSDCSELALDIVQKHGNSVRARSGDIGGINYVTVDQIALASQGDTQFGCDCGNQPFEILRSSAESEGSEFFLKLNGEGLSNCSYIARAKFLDHDLYDSKNEIGLTNWMTLGANFQSSRYLYIDKNHCLVPGRSIEEVYNFLFPDAKYREPFISIKQAYQELNSSEGRTTDLFAFALELTCMSALKSTLVFKGLIIEKPRQPSEFYFINSTDDEYEAIKKKFEQTW